MRRLVLLFHTQAFVLGFLPLTVCLYYLLAWSVRAREWLLIFASAIFYAWWDPRLLPLLIAEVGIAWLVAELHFMTGKRWLLYAGVAFHVAVLAVFKYLDFLGSLISAMTGQALPPSGIILPIGISFFTFQIISYLVDVGRGVTPRYGLRSFSVVIFLFPHLIAGPIVRHAELVPQLAADPRRPGMSQRICQGLILFIVGMATKVLIADRLAIHADAVFMRAPTAAPGFADGWAGAAAFALQIYFDFAAYSEMAIGLALVLGLHFPLNFDMPYRATNLRDFWRRWHMSLSRFLRDYLYVPLGGSRHGFSRFALATLVTMSVCGLWHGAGLPFVIWGGVHGLGLVACRAWQERGPTLPDAVGWLATFTFAVAAFVPFRAPDLATTKAMLAGMSGFAGPGSIPEWRQLIPLAIALGLALLPWNNVKIIQHWWTPAPGLAVLASAIAFWLVLEVGRGQPSNFIYFQF